MPIFILSYHCSLKIITALSFWCQKTRDFQCTPQWLDATLRRGVSLGCGIASASDRLSVHASLFYNFICTIKRSTNLLSYNKLFFYRSTTNAMGAIAVNGNSINYMSNQLSKPVNLLLMKNCKSKPTKSIEEIVKEVITNSQVIDWYFA